MFVILIKYIYIFTLTIIPLLPALSFGKSQELPATTEQWTLKRIIQRSLENAPAIKASTLDTVAAENKAHQAGIWDNPEVSASLGKKTVGSASGKSLQLSILQSIPLFGKKSIVEKIGLEEALTFQTEKEILLLSFQHQIARLTYQIAAIDEQLKHISHRRERIRLVEGYLKSRPFASPTQAVEKHLIENRLREIEDRFAVGQSLREQQWESLNMFLDINSHISPYVNWYQNPTLPDKVYLSQKSTDRNLELLRQNHILSTAQLEIEKAGKKVIPEIQLGIVYSEENADQKERNYFGTLQLSIPIVDSGGKGIEAAVARRNAEKYRLEHKQKEVASQFGVYWAALVEGKKRIQIYPLELLSKLELEMDQTEKDWKKGLIPILSLLELESQVHEQAAKIYDAQVYFVSSLSQIHFLSGQSFPIEE